MHPTSTDSIRILQKPEHIQSFSNTSHSQFNLRLRVGVGNKKHAFYAESLQIPSLFALFKKKKKKKKIFHLISN